MTKELYAEKKTAQGTIRVSFVMLLLLGVSHIVGFIYPEIKETEIPIFYGIQIGILAAMIVFFVSYILQQRLYTRHLEQALMETEGIQEGLNQDCKDMKLNADRLQKELEQVQKMEKIIADENQILRLAMQELKSSHRDLSEITKHQIRRIEKGQPNRPRFTILVEKTSLDDEGFLTAIGEIYGPDEISGSVYIFRPGQVIKDEIVRVERDPKGRYGRITLLNAKNVHSMPRFSVITNIPPLNRKNDDVPVENPYLVGLSFGQERFMKERLFQDLMRHELKTAIFLMPMKVEGQYREENGRIILEGDGTISFPTLQNPYNSEEDSMLPIFTDWGALELWTDAFREGRPRTLEIHLVDCMKFASEQDSGIVINPFGPKPLPLTPAQIQEITGVKPEKKEAESGETLAGEESSDRQFSTREESTAAMLVAVEVMRRGRALWSQETLWYRYLENEDQADILEITSTEPEQLEAEAWNQASSLEKLLEDAENRKVIQVSVNQGHSDSFICQREWLQNLGRS